MAIWKKILKKKGVEEELPKKNDPESAPANIQSATPEETPPTKEQPKREEPIPEKPPEEISGETRNEMGKYVSGGVFVFDKKISGFFGKGFWGLLSVFIFPPVLVFALSLLVIVCMLVFPLLTLVLLALIPAVFVTLSVLIIALPVLFPLLILFLLITGKGKLLLGSEGKWFGIEMFGKSYTLK
ncbi:MAG: hypothetical protein B6D35_08370 [Candidatus Brocadia sp. UTAMX2]|jgi:hypothetical protein|nr:MAG: hypothetical protein B6D35_08370 [Candidatus Brocadia sp. UTAMX2]